MGREVPGGRAVLAGGGRGEEPRLLGAGGAQEVGGEEMGADPRDARGGCREEADSLARSRPRPWPREGKHRRDPKAQERR